MRIVVIGANGQLGTDLCAQLGNQAVPLTRPAADVTDLKRVEAALTAARPDYVINCAAFTNVDACEDDGQTAFSVNALGAARVARAAARLQVPVMYISTDYVFGAESGRAKPYTELDLPGPVNVYGVSKLAGEHLTLSSNPRAAVVRTCGLYGRTGARGKGGNFVETIRRLARQGGPLRVVDDQRLSPTSTVQAARRIAALATTRARGIFHVAAADHYTWFELAAMIVRMERAPVQLQAVQSDAQPRPARRPAMSALASTRLAEAGVTACPPCEEMLAEYLNAEASVSSPTA